MTNIAHVHLPYPTCAQCKGIGLQAVPDWQFDMEDELGFDVLKELILSYGGREYLVCSRQIDDPDKLDRAQAWLFNRFGPGKLIIPLGPLAHKNRAAWAIYTMLRTGASLAQTAVATGVHTRAVSRHRKRLQEMGALPVFRTINTGEPQR